MDNKKIAARTVSAHQYVHKVLVDKRQVPLLSWVSNGFEEKKHPEIVLSVQLYDQEVNRFDFFASVIDWIFAAVLRGCNFRESSLLTLDGCNISGYGFEKFKSVLFVRHPQFVQWFSQIHLLSSFDSEFVLSGLFLTKNETRMVQSCGPARFLGIELAIARAVFIALYIRYVRTGHELLSISCL